MLSAMRARLLAFASVGLLGAAAAAQAPEVTVFPVRFSVAPTEAGEPVVDRPWIDAQVGWANRIFTPARIAFEVAEVVELPRAHHAMETRADRHALGQFLESGVINAFLVSSLRDVDDPSRYRQGVHWRPRGGYPEGSHLVIVSRIAGPTVLAHELGHFFGNRRHPETAGNIMSYSRGEGVPFFDATQLRRIARFRERFIATGELRARARSRETAP